MLKWIREKPEHLGVYWSGNLMIRKMSRPNEQPTVWVLQSIPRQFTTLKEAKKAAESMGESQ